MGTENRKFNFKLLRGRLGKGASCGKLFTYIKRCARKFHIFWYQSRRGGRWCKYGFEWKTDQNLKITGVKIAWVDMKSNEYPLFYINDFLGNLRDSPVYGPLDMSHVIWLISYELYWRNNWASKFTAINIHEHYYSFFFVIWFTLIKPNLDCQSHLFVLFHPWLGSQKDFRLITKKFWWTRNGGLEN